VGGASINIRRSLRKRGFLKQISKGGWSFFGTVPSRRSELKKLDMSKGKKGNHDSRRSLPTNAVALFSPGAMPLLWKKKERTPRDHARGAQDANVLDEG